MIKTEAELSSGSSACLFYTSTGDVVIIAENY